MPLDEDLVAQFSLVQRGIHERSPELIYAAVNSVKLILDSYMKAAGIGTHNSFRADITTVLGNSQDIAFKIYEQQQSEAVRLAIDEDWYDVAAARVAALYSEANFHGKQPSPESHNLLMRVLGHKEGTPEQAGFLHSQ